MASLFPQAVQAIGRGEVGDVSRHPTICVHDAAPCLHSTIYVSVCNGNLPGQTLLDDRMDKDVKTYNGKARDIQRREPVSQARRPKVSHWR